jgi:DNA modification methylase
MFKTISEAEKVVREYTLPERIDTPQDAEIGKYRQTNGPNNKLYNTPLVNLKMVDHHYEGILDIAKDIKKQEMSNPSSNNWHILNS